MRKCSSLLCAPILALCLAPPGSAEHNPKRAHKLFQDGVRLEAARQFAEALQAFSQSIDLAPEEEPSWFHAARVRYAQGDFKNALADLDKAIQLAASDGEAHQLRGDCYRQLKDPAKALAEYDRAVELKADNAALYNSRAAIYAETGQTEKAIAEYGRGIRLRLDDPVPIRARGNLYANLGKFRGAPEDYEQSINLRPDFIDPY